MERSNHISYDEFIDQFLFVKKVVLSCKTSVQLENAKKWADGWSKRMKVNAPNFVDSQVDLYLSVIEK